MCRGSLPVSARMIRTTWEWQFSINSLKRNCVPAAAVPATKRPATFVSIVSIFSAGARLSPVNSTPTIDSSELSISYPINISTKSASISCVAKNRLKCNGRRRLPSPIDFSRPSATGVASYRCIPNDFSNPRKTRRTHRLKLLDTFGRCVENPATFWLALRQLGPVSFAQSLAITLNGC